MGIDWAREKYEMRLEENWPLSYRLWAVMVALLIMPLTYWPGTAARSCPLSSFAVR
jgi:hypothetical protein